MIVVAFFLCLREMLLLVVAVRVPCAGKPLPGPHPSPLTHPGAQAGGRAGVAVWSWAQQFPVQGAQIRPFGSHRWLSCWSLFGLVNWRYRQVRRMDLANLACCLMPLRRVYQHQFGFVRAELPTCSGNFCESPVSCRVLWVSSANQQQAQFKSLLIE